MSFIGASSGRLDVIYAASGTMAFMARRPASKSKSPQSKRPATKPASRRKSHKPTHDSVTSKPCVCKYLELSAENPSVPIAFDEQTNEYHYRYEEPGSSGFSTLVIYHCPFCGGAAPKTKRHLLFHVIPPREVERLTDLIGAVTTLEDVIRKLGRPDVDDPHGVLDSPPEEQGQPPTTQWSRTAQYTRLSDVADVWFTERSDGRAGWQLVGKYRGPQQGSSRNLRAKQP